MTTTWTPGISRVLVAHEIDFELTHWVHRTIWSDRNIVNQSGKNPRFMSSTKPVPNKFYRHSGNSPWNNHLLHIALVGKKLSYLRDFNHFETFFNDCDLVFLCRIGEQQKTTSVLCFSRTLHDTAPIGCSCLPCVPKRSTLLFRR